MDPMMIKEQHHDMEYSNGQWQEMNEYQSPHMQSPAHEYGGYGFVPTHGMPIDSPYNRPPPPMYSAAQQPQPVFPAQWPSMLTNPSIAPQSQMPSQPPTLAPMPSFVPPRPLPPLTTTNITTTSTGRRTLTDQDRRRMCQYHEDNPAVKQTEIGAMFGVERSTVSKVLRQSEKYLMQDDGGRSPLKKAKGKFPDIERALSNWARNHQRKGLALSDKDIREKAKFFATTVGSEDSFEKLNSNTWLEKFKQKNNLTNAKLRKGSDANESDAGAVNTTRSASQTPNGVSPISPNGVVSQSPISPEQGRNNQKTGSPDSYVGHNHSQSATSLASAYSDTTAPSSFSGEHQSPSSYFSSDLSGNNNSTHLVHYPSSHSIKAKAAASSNLHHVRSQQFPAIGVDTGFDPGNGDNLSQKQVQDMLSASVLNTPSDEYSERHCSISSSDIHHLLSQPPSSTHSPIPNSSPSMMAPPPNPIHSSSVNTSNVSSPITSPSQDEARKALELVMNFFQNQPSGVVDPQEYITMGKLMEKLKVHGTVGELPGGMHSIDMGHKEMSRKRSIHTL